jgi:hypothetical protein
MPDQDDTVEYIYNDCRIDPANGEFDWLPLYEDMRTQDMLEIIGLGQHPRQALQESYKISEEAWTVTTLDMRMVGSFGVCPAIRQPNIGVIWLLGTHRMHLIKKTFIKHSKEWIDRLMGDYNVLTNYVMESNELSFRWLTWLGATFSDVGIDGYKQFHIYKNNNS